MVAEDIHTHDEIGLTPQVQDITLAKLCGTVCLVIMLDTGRVMVYSDVLTFAEKVTERFRFKLNASHVLLKK